MPSLPPVSSSPWPSGVADSATFRRGRLSAWLSWNNPDPEKLLSVEQDKVFQEENRCVTLRNARFGAWTVIILVPLCIVLDDLAHPQHFWLFAGLRIACSLLCLPVLAAFLISLMIDLTGEAPSSYFAAFNRYVVGTSFIPHWTIRETAITLGIVIALFFFTALPNLSRGTTFYERGSTPYTSRQGSTRLHRLKRGFLSASQQCPGCGAESILQLQRPA